MAITSVPCFEIWFLSHFELHTKPYVKSGKKSPCDYLISALKKKPGFNKYKKGVSSYYAVLKDRTKTAKKNAKRSLVQSKGARDRDHHGNPSTLMHVLIDKLEKIGEKR